MTARLLAPILVCCLSSLPVMPAHAQVPPRPGTPVRQLSAVDAAKKLAWMRQVYARLLKARRLPPNRAAGQLVLKFDVLPDGHVSSIVTVKSSGDKSLDEHAASMVRSAGPFAPPPAALFRGGVTPVTLPVIYQKQMPQPMIGAPV